MGEYLKQKYAEWSTDQSKYRNSVEELNDIERKIRLARLKNHDIKF